MGSEDWHAMADTYNERQQKPIRRNLRKNMPKGEKLLWSKIRNNQLGHRFRRQYGINSVVLDFYCPELRLAIEVDGITHEDTATVAKDREKEFLLTSISIKLLRFPNSAIFENLDSIASQIYHECLKIDGKLID